MKTALICSLTAVALALLGCGSGNDDQSGEVAEIGTMQQALITWQGELIERNDNGSQQTAYYMYTLDTPDANVCGWTGKADYIVHYNRAGAYANRSKLRMDAETYHAQCFLNWNPSGLSARVYDNDHVMVCAGETRVWLCGTPEQVFSGLKLWQAP